MCLTDYVVKVRWQGRREHEVCDDEAVRRTGGKEEVVGNGSEVVQAGGEEEVVEKAGSGDDVKEEEEEETQTTGCGGGAGVGLYHQDVPSDRELPRPDSGSSRLPCFFMTLKKAHGPGPSYLYRG
jgi:hypothetical protein